jgi:uncharacterized protein (TIGR03435 family)
MSPKIAIVTALAVCAAAHAQTVPAKPHFDSASIKKSGSNSGNSSFGFLGGRQFASYNHTLKECLVFAYNVTPKSVSGGPAWVDSEHYDIVADTGTMKPSIDQTRLMFQTLLESRFKLAVHRTKQQMPVYTLLRGAQPLKLIKSTAPPDKQPSLVVQGLPPRSGRLPARNASMADFSAMLQRIVLDRPVVDKTKLNGKFDFDLDFAFDGTQLQRTLPPKVPGKMDLASSADIFFALQSIGLKLEPSTGPVSTLAIDRADKPTLN